MPPPASKASAETVRVALLRNINTGGFSLKSAELLAMAEAVGLARPATHAASGNLLFASALDEAAIIEGLEARLLARFGRPVPVMLRTAAELAATVAADPFPETPGSRKLAVFLQAPPPPDAAAHARRLAAERIALGPREIFISYPEGVGASRLVLPAAKAGTARNLDVVRRLADLAAGL